MIPPLVRRCPECGHVSWSHRFAAVAGRRRVVCPVCHTEFETADDPRLN